MTEEKARKIVDLIERIADEIAKDRSRESDSFTGMGVYSLKEELIKEIISKKSIPTDTECRICGHDPCEC